MEGAKVAKARKARKAKSSAGRTPSRGGTAHPGFANVQAGIAKKLGISKKRAGAVLASQTRKASPAAKKRNPRLLRVRGK
jgi:hypothetical protein